MAEMTSRERVVTALNHREPDRVPFDCTFSYGGYNRLAEYLGFTASKPVMPGSTWLSVSAPMELLRIMKVDLLYVGLNRWPNAPVFEYGIDTFTDEWGITYRKAANPTGVHYEFADHPLKDASVEDLADYPWPDPTDPGLTAGLEEKARILYETTDFALVGKFSNSIYETAFMLRGVEQWYMDLVLNPAFVEALMDRLTDIAICLLEAGLKTMGQYVQIVRLAGDDMGHQRGTIMSPRMFRRLVKPRFMRLYGAAKRLMSEYAPDAKLKAHTDGDVYPIIPDYIECGLDVLNPVQPYVAEMDHEVLKAEFGERLSFHGGMDIQGVLPFGTPQDVTAEARKVMSALGRGGGYILAPTHYVQPDVPPENLIALRDAVLEYGRYPLID